MVLITEPYSKAIYLKKMPRMVPQAESLGQIQIREEVPLLHIRPGQEATAATPRIRKQRNMAIMKQ
jgi:hypothetical protein